MTEERPVDSFSGLSEEVGARLSERRAELAKTLRQVASEAAMSASHLSDIENGRSQVSIPVLLRLMNALDLSVAELLPRIGGKRSTGGALADLTAPSSELSHDGLELSISYHRLEPNDIVNLPNPDLKDLLIHVLTGSVTVRADAQDFELGPGDTFDSERLDQCKVSGRETLTTIITATRTEKK